MTHTLEPIGPTTGPISSGGAPRLPMQRRAPRVFCSGALRACLWALHAAVAVPFINRALENWGGLNWEDRFHHNDRSHAQRGGIGASLQRGVVMTRKKAETHRAVKR